MRRFFSSVLLALLLIPAIPGQQAHACSCMMQTPREVFENADFVFRGRVVAKESFAVEDGGYVHWENRFAFEVNDVYKGPLMNGVLVTSNKDSAACGVDFALDREGIVTLYRSQEGDWRASLCGSFGLDEDTIAELEEESDTPPARPDCVPVVCPTGAIRATCDVDGDPLDEGVSCIEESPFPDVEPGDPDYEAIKYVKLARLFEGNADGTFRPESSITRAELVTVLFRQAAEQGSCNDRSRFSDVESGSWYAETVCLAREAGVVKGYADGTFRPHQAVTLGEAAKIILVQNYQWQADTYPDREREAIADGNPWWLPYAEDLAPFIDITRFGQSVDEPVSRAEVARILHEMWKGQDM